MTAKLTESAIESFAINRLEHLGYGSIYAPNGEEIHGSDELDDQATTRRIRVVRHVRTMSEHLGNTFFRDKLLEDSVLRQSRVTAADGKRYAGWNRSNGN